MSDDETKNEMTDETQQDAGPVADEDTSSSQATDEAPSSAPPASDAPSADAPAAEAEAPSEPNPEDDLPWKQRRRLQRSRLPHEAGPELTDDERAAARAQQRAHKAAERRKERAAEKAKRDGSGSGTPPAERVANASKIRQGIVVSSKGDKSITVRIDTARRHRTYEKIVRSSSKLHAHDERNEAGEGDVVQVVETRPLSKTKRWRLVGILEKAK